MDGTPSAAPVLRRKRRRESFMREVSALLAVNSSAADRGRAIGSGAPAPPSRGTSNSPGRGLGLDVPIPRRDFLDSTLLAAGAALLQVPPPQGRSGATLSAADWQGYGGIGDYASSNGNTWEAMTTAHKLRDRQLGGADAAKQAVDTGERYDLIVVGGGLSGLAAAYFFMKGRG